MPTDRWRIFSSGRPSPAIPEVQINRDADITPDQMPAMLDGAEIVIIDHTPLPTDVARRCIGLKHVVFLGTGARSYMNPEELAELGIAVHLIKGYGDTAVAECAIALMWAAARGIARWTARCAPATGCARTACSSPARRWA